MTGGIVASLVGLFGILLYGLKRYLAGKEKAMLEADLQFTERELDKEKRKNDAAKGARDNRPDNLIEFINRGVRPKD